AGGGRIADDLIEDLAVGMHESGDRKAERARARLEIFVIEIAVRVIDRARLVEIGGGELRLLQKLAALRLAKSLRGLRGLVHETLEIRHEGGGKRALEADRPHDR